MILYSNNNSRYEVYNIYNIKDSYTKKKIANIYDFKINYSNIVNDMYLNNG